MDLTRTSSCRPDECETGKGCETPARALYDRYKDWARRNHEAEISERKFAGLKTSREGRTNGGYKPK